MSFRDAIKNPILLMALLIGVVFPFVTAAISGNLSIPHNDSWAYSRIAKTYSETGQIELYGWNRASLVGQILPFGKLLSSLVVQHLIVAVFSIMLIFSAYFLLTNYLDQKRSAILARVLAIWPGYALLTTSFMSDIPALATTFMSLAIAENAMNKRSINLFILSLCVAIWSVTIREQGLAAFVAIIGWAIYQAIRYKVFEFKKILSIGILFSLALVAFFLWRTSLPSSDSASFTVRPDGLLVAASGFVRGYFEFALILLPATLLAGAKLQKHKVNYFFAVLVTAFGAFQYFYAGAAEFFLPNYLSNSGSYSSVLPPSQEIFPSTLWLLLIVSALISGIIFMLHIPLRHIQLSLLSTFTALMIAGTLLQFILDQGVFGRYLLPIAPFVFYLVVRFASEQKTQSTVARTLNNVSLIQLILIASLSIGLMAHSFSFDRKRWDIATELSNSGINPMQIDAGLEWLGWNSPNGVIGNVRAGTDPFNYWAFNVLFKNQPCLVLSPSKKLPIEYQQLTANWRLFDSTDYPKFLGFGQRTLYIFETSDPLCK